MPTQTFHVDDLAKENAKLSKDVIRMAIDLEDHKKVDTRMPRSKWNSGKPGKLAGYKSSKDLGSRTIGAKEVSFSGLSLVDSLPTYPISHEFDPLQVVEENNFESHKALPMKERISKMKQTLVQRDVVQITEGESEVNAPKQGLEVPVKKISVNRTQDLKIQKLKKEYKVFKDEDKKSLHELEKEEQTKTHQTASVVNLLVPDPGKSVTESNKNSETSNAVTQKTRSRVGLSSFAKTQKSSFCSDEVNSCIMLPPEPLVSANPNNNDLFKHRKKKRNSVLNSPVKRAAQKDDEGSLIINNTIKEKDESASPSSPTRPIPVKEKPKYTYDAALSDWLSGLNLKESEKVKDTFFSNNISLVKMHLLNAKDLTRFGFKQSDPDFVKILRGLIELKEDYSRFPEKYKLSTSQKFVQKEAATSKASKAFVAERKISGENEMHRKNLDLNDSAEGLLPPISHQQRRNGQNSVSSSTEIDQKKVAENLQGAKHLPLERVGSGSLVNHAVKFQKIGLNESTGSISSNNVKDRETSETIPPQNHEVLDVEISLGDQRPLIDGESFTNEEAFDEDLKESPAKNQEKEVYPYTSGDHESGDGTSRKVSMGTGPLYNKDPAKLSKILSSDLAHKDAITALELATRKLERRQKEQEEELEKAEKLEKQKKNERDRLAARHASRRRMQQQLQVQQQINALSSDVNVPSTNQNAPPQDVPSDQHSSPEHHNGNQLSKEEASVAFNAGDLDFELIGAKIKPQLSSRGAVNQFNPSTCKGPNIYPSLTGTVASNVPNTSQKSRRNNGGINTNDTLPSDRVDPENGLVLEGKAVTNSPRADFINKPQTQRANRDTEVFKADQQSVHTFRGRTYDKDFQSIKKDLESVLGQLETSDLSPNNIAADSTEAALLNEKNGNVLVEATKRKIKDMETVLENELKFGEMQEADSNISESNPSNANEGSSISDPVLNKDTTPGIPSGGKQSSISTNSTHDLLQQLETKLQTLKDSGSSPETLSMIEKIKTQLAQFEAANPQTASRLMSEYPSYARAKGDRKVSSAKMVGPGASGTREKSIVGKERSRSSSKSKTLLTLKTSMAEQDMVKSLQKQQTQYKQQIKNLERELKRLKENDSLQSCELNIEDLQYSEEDHIGDGAFADVFWGYYSGSEVAIKRLKNQLSSSDESYFNAEVSLLRELRHPNVVLLLGTCRDSQGHPLMILEYMASGSLFDVLHDFERPGLDHVAFYQICKDMAVGMNYLHKHKPGPVLHLDLKSMNVLLDIYGKAKIGDFGFSKLKTSTDSGTEKLLSVESRKGSPAWMAPETLQQGKVSTKSDVYSFGIILWEMLTRDKPYEGMGLYRVLEGVTKGLRPLIPGWVPDELQTLIQRCWHAQPSMRPSFQEVLEILDNLHLPSEWKSLLDAAGVPRIALEDPDVTRSIVEFVHLSLNVSDCSSSAPTSGDGLSASVVHQERQMIDLEVVSALEMLTRKQKEKSYQCLVPTLSNFTDSFSEKSLFNSENKVFPQNAGSHMPRASTEVDFRKQPAKLSSIRESSDVDNNVYIHSSRPRTVIGASGVPIKYQISDAILQSQRAKLRPTTVAPHPSQLAKLSGIDEGKLSSIAAIIKQALNERREQMGDSPEDDNSTVVGDGSERSD